LRDQGERKEQRAECKLHADARRANNNSALPRLPES
jgi:hypothetical protein